MSKINRNKKLEATIVPVFFDFQGGLILFPDISCIIISDGIFLSENINNQ